MKKVQLLSPVVVFLVLVSLLAFVPTVSGADQVVFADHNLEAAVREELGRFEGPLAPAELAEIKIINAAERGITDLTGIEYLTGLEYLNLRNNDISDISPLAQLNKLTYLNLHSNTAITDLSPIGGLTNLETLILRNVPINEQTDVLADLINLKRLNINNTGITDLTVLGELLAQDALRDEVDLGSNPIFISAVEGLDGFAPIRKYWEQVSSRSPRQFPELNGQYAVINEVMARNGRSVLDQDEEPSDWIELYNPTDRSVHLGGCYLSDDLNNLTKWPLPADTWLEPGGFLLVWASGKDQTGPELHTSFKIDHEGEQIILTHRDRETIIDYFYVSPVKMDISWGRQPDGGSTIVMFGRNQASPGESNNTGLAYLQPNPGLNPSFSHQGGFYEKPFMLTLDPAAGTTVYFTLDGSIPDPINNPHRTYEYTDSIIIREEKTPVVEMGIPIFADVTPKPPLTHLVSSYNKWYLPRTEQFRGTVVRARAYDADHVPSEVITHTYFVDPQGFDRHSLPVISITADPVDLFDYNHGIYLPGRGFHENLPWAYHHWGSGNFHGRGRHWERPIHIEFWEPDGTLAIAQNAGVRIHGDASRAYAQKSLRIIASSDYDQRDVFEHEIFPGRTVPSTGEPYTNYKAFVLRNGGNTWENTMLKDGLIANLLHHTKLDPMYFRPAVVYLNGEYWGIHNIRDRQDEWYLHHTYGVDPDQVEIVEDNVFVNEGNAPLNDLERQNYRKLLQLIDPNYRHGYRTPRSLKDPELYDLVKEMMDIDAYLDYAAVQIYIQNHDWPGNNVRLWRLNLPANNPDAPYGHDGKWRWMIYDLDLAFANFSANTMVNATRTDGWEWHNPSWATYLLRALLENPEFKIDFLNRCADHMNSTFLPEVVIAELDRLKKMMEPEIDEHIRRWDRPAASKELWKLQNNNLRIFAEFRPGSNQGHIIRYFRLTGMYKLTIKTEYAKGYVRVNSLNIAPGTPGVSDPNNWSGKYFNDIPITLTAIPHEGQKFVGWIGVPQEMQHEPTITIIPSDSITIQAVFI